MLLTSSQASKQELSKGALVTRGVLKPLNAKTNSRSIRIALANIMKWKKTFKKSDAKQVVRRVKRKDVPPLPFIKHLRGHEGHVNAVAVFGDGKRACTGSKDKTVRIWNLENLELIHTFEFEGHKEAVNCVAVIGDRGVVSGSEDGVLMMWDIVKMKSTGIMTDHSDAINAVAVTRDRKRFVSASSDNMLKVWEIDSLECVQTLEGHSRPVMCVAVYGDGKRLVSGSRDKKIHVWVMVSVRTTLHKIGI